jgi:hypothetical protein
VVKKANSSATGLAASTLTPASSSVPGLWSGPVPGLGSGSEQAPASPPPVALYRPPLGLRHLTAISARNLVPPGGVPRRLAGIGVYFTITAPIAEVHRRPTRGREGANAAQYTRPEQSLEGREREEGKEREEEEKGEVGFDRGPAGGGCRARCAARCTRCKQSTTVEVYRSEVVESTLNPDWKPFNDAALVHALRRQHLLGWRTAEASGRLRTTWTIPAASSPLPRGPQLARRRRRRRQRQGDDGQDGEESEP